MSSSGRRRMTRRFLARLRDETVKLENQELLRELMKRKRAEISDTENKQ